MSFSLKSLNIRSIFRTQLDISDGIFVKKQQKVYMASFGAITHTKISGDYVIKKRCLWTSLCHTHTKASGTYTTEKTLPED